MAFTVGGGDGANSYVSVSYADDYFADRGISAWSGTDLVKQGALVRATDYVKTFFSARFDPVKVDPLDLPDVLQRAVCEYAVVELQTPGGLAPAPVVDASGYTLVNTKKKIGPLEKTFSVVSDGNTKPGSRRSFPIPDSLIASLLLPLAGFSRVTR